MSIYLDDSGVFHLHSQERFFVYAGYAFTSPRERDRAAAIYDIGEKQILSHRPSFLAKHRELKAFTLSNNQKRYLTSIMKDFEAIACVIDKEHIPHEVICNKKQARLYKNACISQLASLKIEGLLRSGKLDASRPATIRFYIDNQPIVMEEGYDFANIIKTEILLRNPILKPNNLNVSIKYCDSAKCSLVRASDLLANLIWTKHNHHPHITPANQHLDYLYLP